MVIHHGYEVDGPGRARETSLLYVNFRLRLRPLSVVSSHSVGQWWVSMSDLQHSAKSTMELRNTRNPSPFGSGPTSRKLAAYLLASLVIVTMVIWIGFVSWGLLSLVHWLLDRVHFIWTLL